MKFRFLAVIILGFAGIGEAQAQRAGDNVTQLGYGHVITLDNSNALNTALNTSVLTNLAGIRSPFESPGTGAKISNSNTPFFALIHFITDNIAVSPAGGIPANFKLFGKGTIRPTGVSGALLKVDLADSANNPLASVRQWTPVLLGQYYFGTADAEIRPFVGIGASYTFFTNIKLNDNFVAQSEANFGDVLALANGKATPTHVVAYASSSFQPLVNMGVSQRVFGNWSVTASATFALLQTRADIKILSKDNTVLSDSTTRINLDPLALTVFVNYNLGPGVPFLH